MTPSDMHLSTLFESIDALVRTHSPSGFEGEIDALLVKAFEDRGVTASLDACGNLVAFIQGSGKGCVAITAHKDEIGAIVTAIGDDGRLRVRKLGGSYPWIYGEGPVDILGDEIVPGILSFGSRHVSHASPQHAHMDKAPVQWSDVWVETKRSAEELCAAGVRPGARVTVARARKTAVRMGDHVASYTLDNKASIAILLELAHRLQAPVPSVYLVASTKEEIGASGGLYFARQHELDAMIALEIAPLSEEYQIKDSAAPVLMAEDSFTVYHDRLNSALRGIAQELGVSTQTAMVSAFGSDASVALKFGQVPRAACLAFATENTHGFEIASLAAIANCASILEGFCNSDALERLTS